VSTESLPSPVPSQLVYTSRVMPAAGHPGASPGMAGKVSVASSRRAIYQPGVVSDVDQPSPPLRQIPVVLVPRREPRVFEHSASYQESRPVSDVSPGLGHSMSAGPRYTKEAEVISPGLGHSVSAGPRYTKEAEVDALTDLLVQNMNVAGNPDFCGTCIWNHVPPHISKLPSSPGFTETSTFFGKLLRIVRFPNSRNCNALLVFTITVMIVIMILHRNPSLSRYDSVLVNRLRIGHTRLTNSYLLKGDN